MACSPKICYVKLNIKGKLAPLYVWCWQFPTKTNKQQGGVMHLHCTDFILTSSSFSLCGWRHVNKYTYLIIYNTTKLFIITYSVSKELVGYVVQWWQSLSYADEYIHMLLSKSWSSGGRGQLDLTTFLQAPGGGILFTQDSSLKLTYDQVRLNSRCIIKPNAIITSKYSYGYTDVQCMHFGDNAKTDIHNKSVRELLFLFFWRRRNVVAKDVF